MAKTKTSAVQTAAPDKAAQFAATAQYYMTLPAGQSGAFKGTEPNAPASVYQKEILAKAGIETTDATTKLQAHGAINAFKKLEPEQWKVIEEMQANAKAARAYEKAMFKGYTINAAEVDKPASYSQIVQLNEAGIRKYSDPSDIPTRGEVCDKMNELYKADPDKYNKAMTNAGNTINAWKHSPPSEKQVEFATSLGIKVAPFTPASKDGLTAQFGSTHYSVGEKIHDFRIENPEKFAEAKAASAAKYAPKDVTAGLDQKAKAAVEARMAANAAKTAPTYTIPTMPEAPAAQVQASAGDYGA